MEILSCGEHSVLWSAGRQQTIAMADSDYFTAIKCIIGTLYFDFDQRRGTRRCIWCTFTRQMDEQHLRYVVNICLVLMLLHQHLIYFKVSYKC